MTSLYRVLCTVCDWLVLSFNKSETLQGSKILILIDRLFLSFCLQGYWSRRDDTVRKNSTNSHGRKSRHHWFIRTDNSITGRDDPCCQRNGETRFQDSTAYWRSDDVQVNLTILVQIYNWGPDHRSVCWYENAYFLMPLCLSSILNGSKTLMKATAFLDDFKSAAFC